MAACWFVIMLMCMMSARVAQAETKGVVSGLLSIFMDDKLGNSTLHLGEQVLFTEAPAVFLNNKWNRIGGTLTISALFYAPGSDQFGDFDALQLDCLIEDGSNLAVTFTVRAYQGNVDSGQVIYEVAIPAGASGTQIQPPPSSKDGNAQRTPPQFAPFPSFVVNDPLRTAGYACFHPDKVHLQVGSGVATLGDCASLSGGPTLLFWPRSQVDPTLRDDGVAAAMFSPADSFRLSLQRIGSAPFSCQLFFNQQRNDYVFCAAQGCDETQTASQYTVISSEGIAPAEAGPGSLPLYFWWSPTKQANWVTTSTTPPDPTYTSGPNANGFIFNSSAPSRWSVELWLNSQTGHASAVASPAAKALLKSRGFAFVQVLGYVDSEGDQPDAPRWSFGVSGEVESVPVGFRARTIIRMSTAGLNTVVDGWGSAMRAAYNTTKKADEDVFITSLSVFSDNGATTLGLGWPSSQPPPPGGYRQLNWTAVNLTVLSDILDDVRATGVPPRAFQFDAWWYPAAANCTPDYLCASDWSLPAEHYAGGLGPARLAMGTPFMLYLPAVCPGPSHWEDKYDLRPRDAAAGFRLPSAEQSYKFFGDLFTYARGQTDPHDGGRSLWPGVHVPDAVRAGWSNANGVAAYETDFFWNMLMATPELRSEYGAAETLLRGIADAAADNNMTVQVCAGEMPDWLAALEMPTITQGRGSIDYAWSIGDPGPNGAHNWAAADGGWAFWAVRIAESKDNFWSSFRNFAGTGFSPDRPTAGHDCELHAAAAILSAGPVGLGDYTGMPNTTLIQRLARADGVLLRPDRTLAPMDVLVAGLVGVRGLPNGARLWTTHATVAAEDPDCPELTTTPTRRIVSHTGVDATRVQTLPLALAGLGSFHLQWLVMSVDVPLSFPVLDTDLYPPPSAAAIQARTLLVRDWHSAACANNTDALHSGCVREVAIAANGTSTALFDAATAGGVTCVMCDHRFTLWSVFPTQGTPGEIIILGDLSKTVSLSGYRFRLLSGDRGRSSSLVVIGAPNEVINITYLVRNASGGLQVKIVEVNMPSSGRTVAVLQ